MPIHLDCGDFVLRTWQPGDAESLTFYANDPAIGRNLRDGFPYPYTRRAADHWISFASKEYPDTFAAIVIEGRAAGGIGLSLHENVERTSAEIGYWLARAYWGRGITTRAVVAMTAYAFSTFPLTRIYAVPFAHNVASSRVLEKAGYTLEGVMRRSAVKEGKIIDQLLYAITDLDWRTKTLPN